MRLINTTSIEVERFTGKPPPYAILSHRWEEEEVVLEDMKPGGDAKRMKGYRKLRLSCAVAARQGLKYIWIDTCCIDKTSSAELSEAINSMFRYYREAEVCYTYLSDVASIEMPAQLNDKDWDFCQSAWFSRGWTLQELIAPKKLVFYNKDWDYLGTKSDFKDAINQVTKVPEKILLGGDLADESVSRKMSWVSSRQTTVPEDIAYCLLGVFGVNIPLLYGEGEENAFLRLQEAILKSSDDTSIFLWRSTEEEAIERPFWGLLAKSPAYFSRSPDIEAPCTMTTATTTAATLTGRGVNVELLLAVIPNVPSGSIYAALMFVDAGRRAYGPLLQKLSHSGGQFTRVGADILLEIDTNMRINYSKLPQRVLTKWIDHELNEAQALRFYVRQNPRTSSLALKEAVGFYFAAEKSLPPELSVDDWSLQWNRWDGGRFLSSGPTHLLEFETDQHLQAPISIPDISVWKYEVSGILQLSTQPIAQPPIASKRLALCAGLRRTSDNFLHTILPYQEPFCFIYELNEHLNRSENADQILKDFSSTNKSSFEQDRSVEHFRSAYFSSLQSGYSASFELQIRYGQVYYLIKVAGARELARLRGLGMSGFLL